MFLDIHAHLYKYPFPYPIDGNEDDFRIMFPTLEQLTAMHDKLDIHRAVFQPLVNAEVYVPQSNGELLEIANESDGRFYSFCNIDPRVLTNTCDAPLGTLIEFYKKQGARGIGEILPNMEFSDPKLQNLFRHAEAVGDMPVLFDLSCTRESGYGIYDDPGLVQLRACLERFPNLIFIGHGPAFWSELGTLRSPEDRLHYPSYPIDAEGAVVKLLRDYKNLWLDLSAGSGSNAMRRDPEYAAKFLSEFSNRAMFGTDICFDGDYDYVLCDFLINLKDSGKLSCEQFENIACKNAERLLNIK